MPEAIILPPEPSNDGKEKLGRRSHRKSRAGCVECKRRRIKCDESRPACINCTSRSVSCSYSVSQASNLTPTHAPVSASNGRHASLPYDGSHDKSLPYYSDLELMHHYTSHASEALGGGEFWTSELPRRSFKNHTLLHMLLALSALHLGQHEASRRAGCIHEADRHYAVALPRVLSELSNLHEGNARDLHAASVLICLLAFARGPRDGQYIAFSNDGKPEWLQLLKGVKTISARYPHVLPASTSASIKGAASRRPDTKPPPDYQKHLSELQVMIERLHAEEPSLGRKYSAPLDALHDCYVAHFEGPEHAKHDHSQVLFSWLYCVPDEYLDALQAKRPLALVIYAYYMVLIKELERQWLYRDWAIHVCKGISKWLHRDYFTYVQWPFDQVGYHTELRTTNDGK